MFSYRPLIVESPFLRPFGPNPMPSEPPSSFDKPVAASGFQPGWRTLAPLVLVTAAGPVSMQMFLPALPALRADLGADPAVAQLTVSLALFIFGAAMLAWGPLSDRFGRRPPLIAGVLVYTVGNMVCATAPTIEVLIAGRALNALGGAAGMVLTRAMVRDVEAPERVASTISLLTVGQIVPPMLAPAVGGLVTDAFGWRMNFVVLLLVNVVSTLFVLRLPETHTGRGAVTGLAALGGSFLRLLRIRRFNGFAGFGAATISTYFAFIAGAPLVAVGTLGLSPSEYGVLFIVISLSFMGGNLVSARLSTALGVDRMVVGGGLVTLLGAAAGLALAATGVWTVPALFGPAMVIAFGNGLSLNNAQAGAMAVDARFAGAAVGLTGFLQMTAGAAMTQVVGLTDDGSPLPMTAAMTGAGVLALLLYAGANLGRRMRPSSG